MSTLRLVWLVAMLVFIVEAPSLQVLRTSSSEMEASKMWISVIVEIAVLMIYTKVLILKALSSKSRTKLISSSNTSESSELVIK